MMKLQMLCGIVQKNQEFLPSTFFRQSNEYGNFSHFWSFEKDLFIKLNLKMMKIKIIK